jgi:hypothetical protein
MGIIQFFLGPPLRSLFNYLKPIGFLVFKRIVMVSAVVSGIIAGLVLHALDRKYEMSYQPGLYTPSAIVHVGIALMICLVLTTAFLLFYRALMPLRKGENPGTDVGHKRGKRNLKK